MSVLSAIQEFIKGCSELDSDSPVWVNYLGESPVGYSIVPLPGDKIVEEYITGKTSRVYPFAFQSMESTLDQLARTNVHEFYEDFAEWIRTQSEQGVFPEMDAGQTPFKIEAIGSGFLVAQGDSQTGVFQIQCQLLYEQDS
jgi:hypothetical protein